MVMKQRLQSAIVAMEQAIAAIDRGELFEALAWLHAAKESIALAEQKIESEREQLGPPKS
jgi:hypothetical protein